MTSWWKANALFPNTAWCSVCERDVRGWIGNRVDGSALLPPIAICPRCDFVHEHGDCGPPLDESRVRDIPR